MSQAIIIVPIYKEMPNLSERLSLIQCFKILSGHPISLVCPASLDITQYKAIAEENKLEIKIERFEDNFFSDLFGYNQLMLSLKFYERFKSYTFLLIYQLDAWVFRDELNYWCGLDYDYIGAPWFKDMDAATKDSPVVGVGNGGFSLRRTLNFISVLRKKRQYCQLEKLLIRINILSAIKRLGILKGITSKMELFNHSFENEDYQFFKFASIIDGFKIAPFEVALKFSFEINSEILFNQNNKILPFGCHAWEKYELNFWKQFIPVDLE
jgi:hypothetical protein